MKTESFDVIIVGAGPGGCACALSLAASGLRIALIEKDAFPRDKICGDALSPDVVNQLGMLPNGVKERFEAAACKVRIHGVRIYSPDEACLEAGLTRKHTGQPIGYLMKRWDFDQLLFEQVKACDTITIFEKCKATRVAATGEAITLLAEDRAFEGKMVVGADGAHSILARHAGIAVEKPHYCAGLRAYYDNVDGFHEQQYIELHFYEDLLPGYFWIFPLPDNQANVGIGMLSSALKKKKVRLKSKLEEIIREHPNVAPRFRQARLRGTVQGFGLPLGSKKRRISGERFVLIGDAASLIDPLTGEGIGNAMRSGRIAATHLLNCFEQQNFSASFNQGFDAAIYRIMGRELKFSRFMQTSLVRPAVFNFLAKRIRRSRSLKAFLTYVVEGDVIYKALHPSIPSLPGFTKQ